MVIPGIDGDAVITKVKQQRKPQCGDGAHTFSCAKKKTDEHDAVDKACMEQHSRQIVAEKPVTGTLQVKRKRARRKVEVFIGDLAVGNP